MGEQKKEKQRWQTEDVWQDEMDEEELAEEEKEEEEERNQIDTAVFAVDGYLSFPATGIRSLFGALEALLGLFNYSQRNTPCCLISRSLLPGVLKARSTASRVTKVRGERTIFTINPESARGD